LPGLLAAWAALQWAEGVPAPASWLGAQARHVIRTRAYASLGNPNMLGAYLLLGLAAAAGELLVAQSAWARRLLGALFVLEGFALFVTYSRGAYLGAAVAAACGAALLGSERREALPRLAPALGALALLALLVPGVLFRVGATRPTQSTAAARLFTWKAALAAWRARPWFGAGPDAVDAVLGRYRPRGVVRPYSLLTYPGAVDDDYLQLLVTVGAVGATLVAAAAAAAGAQFARLRQRLAGAGARRLAAALAGWAGISAHLRGAPPRARGARRPCGPRLRVGPGCGAPRPPDRRRGAGRPGAGRGHPPPVRAGARRHRPRPLPRPARGKPGARPGAPFPHGGAVRTPGRARAGGRARPACLPGGLAARPGRRRPLVWPRGLGRGRPPR
jgi:hypothetical protein